MRERTNALIIMNGDEAVLIRLWKEKARRGLARGFEW
jgi:hypothetical protein